MVTEEFADHGDHPEGDVVDGAFLVPRSQAPALLEPTDRALDAIAPPVGGLVERRFAWLVLARRDHGLDGVLLEPLPDVRVAVPLIPRPLLRPVTVAGTAAEQPPLDQRLEELGFVPLSRGDLAAQGN